MASSKQLSNLEISSFCSQMTMLLRAGIAPAEGVRILLSDTTDSDGKAIFQSILDVCMQGESFSKAVTAAGVFPDYVRNTISLGEQSGNLDVVMQSLVALITITYGSWALAGILILVSLLGYLELTRACQVNTQEGEKSVYLYRKNGLEIVGILAVIAYYGAMLQGLPRRFW